MKTQHYRLSLLVMAMMSAQAWACSVHDHLCSYHALGVPNTSLPINNASTSLIIYAQTDNPSAGAARTDFDNHVLLPENTKVIDAVSPTQVRDTGPYIGSCTNYLCDTVGGERVIKPERLPSFWNDSTTMPRHVYPSQYQVIFNQNSAKAYHTGDLNGGENGQFSPQMGCPSKEGQANCEAVVIIGTDAGGGTNTVPTGIYSQKIHMFDYYNQNPSATMIVGAYATGHGVLIQQSHVDNATTELLGLPKNLVDIAYANGQATNITSSVNTMFDLVGKNAESAQFDYHFYNRGFDAHAAGVKGVTSWQYKQYKPLGWGNTFEQENLLTGNTDIKQLHYGRTDTRTTMIGAEGERSDAWRQGRVYQDGQRTVGVREVVSQPQVFCTNGVQTVSCDQPNAVVFDGKTIPNWSPLKTGRWNEVRNSSNDKNGSFNGMIATFIDGAAEQLEDRPFQSQHTGKWYAKQHYTNSRIDMFETRIDDVAVIPKIAGFVGLMFDIQDPINEFINTGAIENGKINRELLVKVAKADGAISGGAIGNIACLPLVSNCVMATVIPTRGVGGVACPLVVGGTCAVVGSEVTSRGMESIARSVVEKNDTLNLVDFIIRLPSLPQIGF